MQNSEWLKDPRYLDDVAYRAWLKTVEPPEDQLDAYYDQRAAMVEEFDSFILDRSYLFG